MELHPQPLIIIPETPLAFIGIVKTGDNPFGVRPKVGGGPGPIPNLIVQSSSKSHPGETFPPGGQRCPPGGNVAPRGATLFRGTTLPSGGNVTPPGGNVNHGRATLPY